MRQDNDEVDQLDAFADPFGLDQRLEATLPQSGERPAPELAIDRRPFAEMSVQVAPLHSGAGDQENSSQNKPMIFGGSTIYAPRTVTNGSKQPHSASDINPQDQERRLPKATLKQNHNQMGILFLNPS